MLNVFDVRQGFADGYDIAAMTCTPATFYKLVDYYQVKIPSLLACHSQALRISPHLAVLVSVDRAASSMLISACVLRTKDDIHAGCCRQAALQGAGFCSVGN